jgi:hypothetical protein
MQVLSWFNIETNNPNVCKVCIGVTDKYGTQRMGIAPEELDSVFFLHHHRQLQELHSLLSAPSLQYRLSRSNDGIALGFRAPTLLYKTPQRHEQYWRREYHRRH